MNTTDFTSTRMRRSTPIAEACLSHKRRYVHTTSTHRQGASKRRQEECMLGKQATVRARGTPSAAGIEASTNTTRFLNTCNFSRILPNTATDSQDTRSCCLPAVSVFCACGGWTVAGMIRQREAQFPASGLCVGVLCGRLPSPRKVVLGGLQALHVANKQGLLSQS